MEEIASDTSKCHNESANNLNSSNTLSPPPNARRQNDFLNVETICDELSTSEDIKKLKHVQGRSNSTGKLYSSARRVSFPENDSELVTGYLEPADPWASGN